MKETTMNTTCMIVLISITCVCVSFCFPSKPLNERSTELAWEAWLLVDQNNRQGDLGLLRRRITPKSVFIAPTFSPESLPACAEGYISDSMGRCMQIVKINESNHLSFLVEKLKQKFPDTHYKGENSEPSTQGPLQFNIPLLGNDDTYIENETDVAIVVTPTNKKHDKTTTSVKFDTTRNGNDKFNVENIAAILRVKPEDVEMTTIAELSTATAFTTTMRADEETTTLQTTTEVEEMTDTTTVDNSEATTLLEGDAIFFRWKI